MGLGALVDTRAERSRYLLDFDHIGSDKHDAICAMRIASWHARQSRPRLRNAKWCARTCHWARTHARRLGKDVKASECVRAFGVQYVSLLVDGGAVARLSVNAYVFVGASLRAVFKTRV